MNFDYLTLKQLRDIKTILDKEISSISEVQVPDLSEDRGWKIVILQRGWIVVGRLFKSGSEYTLKDGAVIRIWGTSRGLGQIAVNGPTHETVLDPIPETNFHELTTIAQISAVESAWIGKTKQ